MPLLGVVTAGQPILAVEDYEDKNNDYSWADIGHQSRFVRSETRVYYPMALGFKLGRMLHLRFADTVALAKLGNLLFYILVVFSMICGKTL